MGKSSNARKRRIIQSKSLSCEHQPRSAALSRLPGLIELFYGFAIANGLSDALKTTIQTKSLLQWMFLISAFVLAIGEWLAYHLHVSPVPYRSLTRLLMDLVIPALIYCMLLAPALYPSAEGTSYLAMIVLIYFGIGVIYGFLLRRENTQIDRSYIRVLSTSLGLSLIAVTAAYLPVERRYRTPLVQILSTAAIIVWSVYNLRLVYRTMHSPPD